MERVLSLNSQDVALVLDSIKPLQKEEVLRIANGVDLKKDTFPNDPRNASGFLFEKQCFPLVVERTRESVVLGPNLVNYLFKRSPTSELVIPDAIKFDVTGDKWSLTHLFEFKGNKSGKHLTNKMNGFSELLDFFVSESEYLKKIIDKALSEVGPTPQEVSVPPKDNVHIQFVTRGSGNKKKKSSYNLLIHGSN